jgi:predicted acyl esterase
VALTPGEPTLLEIDIWPTSITLGKGTRLRLELLTDDADPRAVQPHP